MISPYRLPHRIPTLWQLRSRELALGARTLIMGIVNVTPDSFSDGGLYLDTDRAVAHALQLLDDGADLLDLGAESTRPGSGAGPVPSFGASPITARAEGDSEPVSADEEQARLLPVVEAVLQVRPDAILSVDTYKSATARAAVDAGAEIVNDVSGFTWDREMAQVCAELRCGVVAMHTRGAPNEWRTQPALVAEEVLPLVRAGLVQALDAAREAGISPKVLVLDPGYGFGKRLDENYTLLAHQAELLSLGRPLLCGLSRKSFLRRTVDHDRTWIAHYASEQERVEARETASIAALVAAILQGASIVRVHNVAAARQAASIADAILAAD